MVELKSEKGQPEVNLLVLDRLVHDYMLEEDLIDDEGTSLRPDGSAVASTASTNNALRALCESVRQHCEAGNLEDTVGLAQSVSATVFQDLRLLFRVQKQEFVEHLRSNSEEGRKKALECMRKKLAPLALNSYPEAYAEFRRALLLLVYSQHEDVSPVASEWSAHTRAELAAVLSRTLRQASGIRFPKLALLLRYLVFTHRMLETHLDSSSRQSGIDASPELKEVISKLLSEDRDPAPFPPERDPFSIEGYLEADIQSLKEAVQLSRQEAVEALRHTKGDVQKAFVNELAAMHLNVSLTDDLVLAYAAHRDLLRVGSSTESSPTQSTGAQQLPVGTATAAMDIDGEVWRDAKMGPSSGPAAARGSQEVHRAMRERPEEEAQDVTAAFDRRPSMSPPKKVARWRGRPGRRRPSPRAPENSAASPLHAGPGASPKCGNGKGDRAALPAASWQTVMRAGQCSTTPWEVDFRDELVKRVRCKIEAEAFQEAMEDMRLLAPACLEGDQELLFELQLACFHKLAAEGFTAEAIRFSRSHLTPLTQDQPHLIPRVKAAVATAVTDPGEARACLRPAFLSQLAAMRMQQALDIREPLLVQLLRVLIASHKAWLKLQRCKDRFEPLLCLDALKDCSNAPVGAAASPSKTGAAACNGSTAAGSGEDAGYGATAEGQQLREAPAHRQLASDSEDDGADGSYSEEDIVLIMEFASLGRAAAIELLQDFGGDTESVLANMFP
ncbi:g9868 [Coccomyxa elongata]